MTISKSFSSTVIIFIFLQDKVLPTSLLHPKGYFFHGDSRKDTNLGLYILQVGEKVIGPCLQTIAAAPTMAVQIDAYLKVIGQLSEDVKQLGILSAETLQIRGVREKLLIGRGPHRELRDVPHFVKGKPKLSSRSEESPCCRAEQFQNSVEIRDADIDAETCSPDRFI
jgi:hypothetical protein